VPALLDASVLIGAEEGPEEYTAISVVSLTELHLGVLVAPDDDTRARRMRRFGVIAATANVHGVPLLTYNIKDFSLIEDLVDARVP
jgi:predicted nucleic acid-binding protein